ncbi:MAG: LacI family DNA-binding transcriptional regulator [Nitriliruptoraceae bacterium]|nr:LacI family DNA-binding transcriptional regulator [Nitriliruptoraceae bacterium]
MARDVRPTIVDVAEYLGLSIATVSRAINDRPGVAASTRARVHEAVTELGFSPQISARRLQGRRARSISLLFPTESATVEAYDLDFVVGAAQATGERDFFFNLHLEQLGPEDLLTMYRSGLVDGVVLMQVGLRDWRAELLAEHGLPFAMIGRTEDPGGAAYIDFDFDGAITLAVEHLASLGHRRVGMVGRPPRQVRAQLGSAVRLETAFHHVCASAGLAATNVGSDLDRTSSYHAVERLLDDSAPTAIVTTHAQAAAAAVRVARARGISIPEELSIVAIGVDRVLEFLDPAPSALVFPAADLGYRAAGLVIDLVDTDVATSPTPQQLLLPAELTLRNTTANPPQ